MHQLVADAAVLVPDADAALGHELLDELLLLRLAGRLAGVGLVERGRLAEEVFERDVVALLEHRQRCGGGGPGLAGHGITPFLGFGKEQIVLI